MCSFHHRSRLGLGLRVMAGLLLASVSGCTKEAPSARPALTSAPQAPARTEAPAFTWAKPEGWKSETIPFPLEFAKTLDYSGVEELRFAPRFFDPSSETYFSYSFAWVLDRPAVLDGVRLSHDLEVYFAGLARAVAPKRFDAKAHAATIEAKEGRYRGIVQTVDAFGDGRTLTLHVDGREIACGARQVVLFTLSPHPYGDATWEALLAQRATFHCS